MFRIEPIPSETLRELKENLCAPGTPKETEPDLPLSACVSPAEAWVSSGLLWGQGLWLQQTWEPCHVI